VEKLSIFCGKIFFDFQTNNVFYIINYMNQFAKCKKTFNYIISQEESILFEKNVEYQIDESKEKYFIVVIPKHENNSTWRIKFFKKPHKYWIDNYFYDYFYSNKQLRKLKLIQINERTCTYN